LQRPLSAAAGNGESLTAALSSYGRQVGRLEWLVQHIAAAIPEACMIYVASAQQHKLCPSIAKRILLLVRTGCVAGSP
jgi:hypothetical protein